MAEKERPPWYSPSVLADQANDSFLSIARSTGSLIRFFGSGAAGAYSAATHVLQPDKKIRGPATPAPERVRERGTPPGPAGTSSDLPAPSKEESPASPSTPPADPPLAPAPAAPPEPAIAELLAALPQRSPVAELKLRAAIDALLAGSEASVEAAAQMLFEAGPEVEPILLRCLDEVPEHSVPFVIAGLARIGCKQLPERLATQWTKRGTVWRLAALRASQWVDAALVRPLLMEGMRDPDAVVRRRALFHTSCIDLPWAVAEVQRLCHDPDLLVGWGALEAMVLLKPTEARERLDPVLRALTPPLRRVAEQLIDRAERDAAAKAIAVGRARDSADRATVVEPPAAPTPVASLTLVPPPPIPLVSPGERPDEEKS